MFVRRRCVRWSQALVLAGVSLLIGTCAVFAPWFARAVEQTVMSEALSGQKLTAAWQLESRAPVRSRGPGQADTAEALTSSSRPASSRCSHHRCTASTRLSAGA